MVKDKFLDGFRDQFDETDPGSITFDTIYKDLEEWSSMMALVIIAFIDDEYSISLSGDDFKNSNTVADLFDIISK